MAKAKEPIKPNNKAIRVTTVDWDDYNDLAKRLSADVGFPVYIPGAIRKAVTFYKESLDK